VVADRRRSLNDDLISDLIRAEDDGDRLTTDELRMLAGALLTAGTDTTRNQLAAAVQALCEHPEQWALLAEHPELVPNAVEEVMRHSPILFTAGRAAVEEVELGGVIIPAGTAGGSPRVMSRRSVRTWPGSNAPGGRAGARPHSPFPHRVHRALRVDRRRRTRLQPRTRRLEVHSSGGAHTNSTTLARRATPSITWR